MDDNKLAIAKYLQQKHPHTFKFVVRKSKKSLLGKRAGLRAIEWGAEDKNTKLKYLGQAQHILDMVGKL